jgi:hypothetical protein
MRSHFFATVKRAAWFCMAGMLLVLCGSDLSVAQTPVSHWTFDEGISNYDLTTVPDIVNGNDAVWQNGNETDGFNLAGLGYVAGKIGGAVRLAGGANNFFLVDAISQLDGISPTPPFGGGDPVLGVGATWSAWIYVDSSNTSTYQGIITGRGVTDETTAGQGVNQNWGINWTGGSLDTRVSGQAILTPANSITRNEWHHLALVWGNVDGSQSFIPPAHQIYVDGQFASQNPDSAVFEIDSSGSWLIGNDTGGGTRQFQGLLDDFAVFDSALSAAQIQTLYNNGLSGTNASGVLTTSIVAGDVDGGGVTIADFNIIRDNLGQAVTARSQGDLNGNRLVDLDDFQQWLNSVPPALANQALASMAVPEPSSLVLTAVVAAVGLIIRPHRLTCVDTRR